MTFWVIYSTVAQPAPVQHSLPPFAPALPDVYFAERGAYLVIADFHAFFHAQK